jgi:hypothetical protein
MHAKLIDCGLSMLLNEDQVQTQDSIFTVTQGAALGTPGYMCPQFSRTRKYGEKSEVYSFGVVLLELLTGKVQMVDEIDLIDLYEDADAAELLAALDTRCGEWNEQVAAELVDIAIMCIARHRRRPAMMPVLRRLGAVEHRFCQPTLDELHLTALAEDQRAELDALRLQAQVAELEIASAMRTCIVCFVESEQSEGVICAQEHFICDGCFGNYVQTEAEQAQEHPDMLRQRNGQVCCPDGRHEPAFTEQQIARHVSDQVYTLHDQARQQVVRQQEFETAQAQMQVEIRRMADQIRRSGGANVGPSPEVLARQLQQQMPNARMCGQCSFGPVDHQACWDLQAHHGEVRGGSRISNACARCGWFSRDINDWPRWDGRLPDEVHDQHRADAQQAGEALAVGLEAAILPGGDHEREQEVRRPMNVTVRSLSGEVYTVAADPSFTVRYIKNRIDEEGGGAASQLCLLFGGRQLDDDHTLSHYNIQNESVLHLRFNISGEGQRRQQGQDRLQQEHERRQAQQQRQQQEAQRNAEQEERARREAARTRHDGRFHAAGRQPPRWLCCGSTDRNSTYCGPGRPCMLQQVEQEQRQHSMYITVRGVRGTFNIATDSSVVTVRHFKTRLVEERHGIAGMMRLFFERTELLDDDRTLSHYNIQNTSVVDLVTSMRGGCVASPMPAVFGVEADADGSQFLQVPGAAIDDAEARALAKRLDGDLEAMPSVFTDVSPISSEARMKLVALLDEHYRSSGDDDVLVTIGLEQLGAVVGVSTAEKLVAFFAKSAGDITEGSVLLIKLRRVEAQGKWIHFHTDTHSKRTMQIALNGEDEYEGGRLLFATGAGFILPHRPAGGVTIHSGGIVHGVNAMVSGVRYGLYLCTTLNIDGHQQRLVQGLVEATMAEFAFFDRALAFLAASTDTDLRAFVLAYTKWLVARLCGGVPGLGNEGPFATELDVGLELVWRCHRLRPLHYKRDCAVLLRAGGLKGKMQLNHLGLDLVAALRRQEKFMLEARSVLKLQFDTKDLAEQIVWDYIAFLQNVQRCPVLVPSLATDLVWHTHMLSPHAYAADCLQLVGHEIDHNDELETTGLPSEPTVSRIKAG